MNSSMRSSVGVIFRSSIVAMLFTLAFAACSPGNRENTVDQNIKTYSHVWDEIINKGKLEMFNSTNFTTNVVMHVSPKDAVGIDSARAYYANFVTGFSDIRFTIKDIFGQGDKLVKYWNFRGTHTGMFFGIPATGKTVDIDGTTLVRMENGRIAEERDFFDNLEFSQQLGLIPR
jgi:steroid delta-isomerase-like uncharacterized protein